MSDVQLDYGADFRYIWYYSEFEQSFVGVCFGFVVGKFLIGMLYERGNLDDILFICVEFIGVWVEQGSQIGQGRDGVEMVVLLWFLGV